MNFDVFLSVFFIFWPKLKGDIRNVEDLEKLFSSTKYESINIKKDL